MPAYRPDRAVRVLTTIVSIAYFWLWAGIVLVLVATPALKFFASDHPEWEWGLQVPATLSASDATVLTRWGTGRLEVEDVRGTLRLPIAMLPWWLFATLWTHTAVMGALMLLFLHHLRRICQRARDGAPFDAGNASRLRWLGWLLIAFVLIDGVAGFVTALAVRRGLASASIGVPSGVQIDGHLIIVALVLVALGEIFRRGAELEVEQSLVV